MIEYKDSGIEWLGTIPAHWEVKRFKSFAKTIKGKSDDYLPDYVEDSHKVLSLECLRQDDAQFYNYIFVDDKEQICNSNDIVVIWDGAGIGEFLRAKDGVLSSTIAKVKITDKKMLLSYLWYWRYKIEYVLKSRPTGMGIPHLNPNLLNNLMIAVPPLAEQQAIADYLDKKTAEIDTQISLLENKQKAYEKLKCSLIDKVVTCGLNPDVELKDSGIDWIGEIPVHWEVKRLKSIFSECKEISSTGNEDLLSVSEYYGVARRLDVMDEDEYDTRADSLVGYKICKKDDLVINIMLAWKRGLGFSDYDGIVSPAYAVYRGKNIVPHYYHYLLRTNKYIAEFKRNSKGIIDSRLRLYSDRFFAINTIVPPLEEQLAVADYLDKKTAEIDECISLTDKKIKAYKRLKQSLIDEVVTGKRKI